MELYLSGLDLFCGVCVRVGCDYGMRVSVLLNQYEKPSLAIPRMAPYLWGRHVVLYNTMTCVVPPPPQYDEDDMYLC